MDPLAVKPQETSTVVSTEQTAQSLSEALTPDLGNDLAFNRKKAVRKRRVWNVTLAAAEVWEQNPAFKELAKMVLDISRTNNKINSKDAISKMRSKADILRNGMPPLTASALTKVIRRTEAACGAVLDKGARVKEVEASWDHFLACLQSKSDAQQD